MYPPRDMTRAATKDGYFGWLDGQPHFWRYGEWIGIPPEDDESWGEDGHTHFGCDPKHCAYDYVKCPVSSTPKRKRNKIPNSTRRSILRRDNYQCVLCGASPRKDPEVVVEVDHIHPHSRGGSNRKANLRVLCDRCNRGKHTKLDSEE